MNQPTLASLAAELQVSRQTVSNVLNFPDRVRPDTRARVMEAIERSGYRPSAAARALRNQKSMALGLRLSQHRNGISGTIVDGFMHALVKRADQRGYRIVLFPASTNDEEVDKLVGLRRSLAIDACILTDTWYGDSRPADLQREGVAFASFGRPWDGDDHGRWVDVDGRFGAMEAAGYLRGLGHDRIGFIGWDDGSPVGRDRREGWAEALDLSDADADLLTVEGEDSVLGGAEAMAALLERGADAAVCASDSLSLGAFTEARRHNRRGVSLVGFDDTPISRTLGLTSVRQPVDEAARVVLDMVLAQLAEPETQFSGVLVQPDLVTHEPPDFLTD